MNGAQQSPWPAEIFLPRRQAGLFLFLSKKRKILKYEYLSLKIIVKTERKN
jgi:hypothetical protein